MKSKRAEDYDVRRGLVLEGGGGKGAFQFGVLLALTNAGITFDAIAGTSVGALNGCLLATHNLELGRRIWMQMSSRHLFSLRPFAATISPIVIFSRLFVASVRRELPSEVSPLLQTALRCLEYLGLLSYFAAGLYEFRVENRNDRMVLLVGTAFAVIMMLLPVVVMKNRTAKPGEIMGVFNAFGLIFMSIFLLTGHVRLAIAICLCCCAPGAVYFVGWLTHRLDLSLLSPLPLRQLVELVASREILLPLFAVIAKPVRYFDVERVTYEPDGFYKTFFLPIPEPSLRAAYIRIDFMRTSERTTALLASCALPLGILPNVWWIDNSLVMDGGVVDNIPFTPLVLDFPCDELIIVRCNPGSPIQTSQVLQRVREEDRTRRVVAAHSGQSDRSFRSFRSLHRSGATFF